MNEKTDRVLDTATKMFDAASEATAKVVAAGKEKVNIATLQRRLAKRQQQLGILVYTQHKTGDKDDEMVKHYIEEIDNIQLMLADLK